VTVHDIIPFITRHDKEINLFNRFEKFLDYLSMQGLKKAKRIITDSEYSKKTLIKYLDYPEERIDVIYLGIDHDKFKVIKNSRQKLEKYGIENECINVLYVGSEMPRKNLQTLIKAFYKLKKKIPNARLIKLGEHQAPEARERLKTLIKKLGLQNDVVFTGYVPEEDLPLFYTAADLFVQPSLYEGFGLPVLEAMACGTSVVSSNATSLPEVVGNAGIMVDPIDVDGFVKAMYEVLTNDGLRENIIKKGLERAKMFTWKKTAEETLKVYEKMEEVE
jgi:glycosyltransferase involved in cell wall biosynthesis